MFYNIDCIEGAKQHLADNSVDLIITDPPYGIAGESLHKHYNRNETTVLDGYIDVPMHEYAEFSEQWIAEAARVLKPGGSMYIVSGYTNLIHILNALHKTISGFTPKTNTYLRIIISFSIKNQVQNPLLIPMHALLIWKKTSETVH